MLIAFRLDDDIAAELDRVRFAAGMNRSEWIASAIAKALLATDRETIPANPDNALTAPSDDGELSGVGEPQPAATRIQIRLAAYEVVAIQLAAAEQGFTPMQWLRCLLRWQLWNKAGELRMPPTTSKEISQFVGNLRAIGINLNQAVRALNAAAMQDSGIDIKRYARDVLAMNDGIYNLTEEVQRAISRETHYWTRRTGTPALTLGPAEI